MYSCIPFGAEWVAAADFQPALCPSGLFLFSVNFAMDEGAFDHWW